MVDDLKNKNGRKLDILVAQSIFGWKFCKVPSDIDGKNECEILTRDGTIPDDIQLPPKGIIPPHFLVPMYHMDLVEAINICRRAGIKTIDISEALSSIELAEKCLKLAISRKGAEVEQS